MASRRKNPTLGGVLIATAAAAGVAALGYGVYATWRPKKKKAKKKTTPGCEEGYELRQVEGVQVCVPVGTTSPNTRSTTNKPGKYVGSPSYTSWPYQEDWPDEQAFVDLLRTMGYEPGTSLVNAKGQQAIKNFQTDYWLVADARGLPQISIDGRLGDQTINALAMAAGIADNEGKTWMQVLESAAAQEPEGDLVIEEDLEFPPPDPVLGSQCVALIQDATQEYANGLGNEVQVVDVAIDGCTALVPEDQWTAEQDGAALIYLRETAIKNGLTDLRMYIDAMLGYT